MHIFAYIITRISLKRGLLQLTIYRLRLLNCRCRCIPLMPGIIRPISTQCQQLGLSTGFGVVLILLHERDRSLITMKQSLTATCCPPSDQADLCSLVPASVTMTTKHHRQDQFIFWSHNDKDSHSMISLWFWVYLMVYLMFCCCY